MNSNSYRVTGREEYFFDFLPIECGHSLDALRNLQKFSILIIKHREREKTAFFWRGGVRFRCMLIDTAVRQPRVTQESGDADADADADARQAYGAGMQGLHYNLITSQRVHSN